MTNKSASILWPESSALKVNDVLASKPWLPVDIDKIRAEVAGDSDDPLINSLTTFLDDDSVLNSSEYWEELSRLVGDLETREISIRLGSGMLQIYQARTPPAIYQIKGSLQLISWDEAENPKVSIALMDISPSKISIKSEAESQTLIEGVLDLCIEGRANG